VGEQIRVRRHLPLILLLCALPVFFVALGANSIWDANEAFYVETPRQMVRSGDYITPTFNGEKRLNKPVLSYWIVAGLYRTFGESVAVERTGIAIGAMGIVLAAFLIGRAIRSPAAGILSALCIATAPRVVWFSRRIFIDVWVTAFMSLALACFVLAEQRPEHRRRFLLLSYVCLGLGVLTKGPAFLALPALVVLIWATAERRIADLRRWMALPGLAIVAAIVLPWYAALYARYGWTYIKSFVLVENVARYSSAMTPDGRGPFFYVPVLLGDLFPWAPLILVPIVMIARTWWNPAATPRDSTRRLLWTWIVVWTVVISYSKTKEDLYIFPTIAAVAALVADTLANDAQGPARRWIDGLLAAVSILCVMGSPAVFWLFGAGAGYYAIPGTSALAAVLGVAGAMALAFTLIRDRAGAVIALAAGFAALNYVFVMRVLPGVERTKPVPALVRTLTSRASPDAKVGYFNMGLQSFVYYTGRGAIEEIGSLEEADAFFGDRREAWALMGRHEFDDLHAMRSDTCIADSHRLSAFDAKFSDIVNRRPPLEVLLVRNHCR